MASGTGLAGIGAASVLMVSVVAGAPTVESVRKEMLDKWARIKSLSATLTTVVTKPEGPAEAGDSEKGETGKPSTAEAKGTYESVRKGDKTLLRIELKWVDLRRATDAAGNVHEAKFKRLVTTIYDGESLHVAMKQGDQDTVNSAPVDRYQAVDAYWLFEVMPEYYDVTLLPEAVISGQRAYVIRLTPKDPDIPLGESLVQIARDTGVVLSLYMHDRDGKEISRQIFTDVKLNRDIPAGRFVPPAVEKTKPADVKGSNEAKKPDDVKAPDEAKKPDNVKQPAEVKD